MSPGRNQGGRPPVLRDGIPTAKVPIFPARLKPSLRARLRALARIQGLPQNRVLENALGVYLGTLDPATLREIAAMVEREP